MKSTEPGQVPTTPQEPQDSAAAKDKAAIARLQSSAPTCTECGTILNGYTQADHNRIWKRWHSLINQPGLLDPFYTAMKLQQ
jgi:hypothetical protein